jgi:hypothetical protein
MLTIQEVPAGPKKVRTIYRGEIVMNGLPDAQVHFQTMPVKLILSGAGANGR